MFDLSRTADLATLALDRPDARNAIPADRWPELSERAEAAIADGARLLLLRGRGGAFCAGADLGDFAGFGDDPAARRTFRETMRDALERIASLSVPTIALIDGPCFGAGVALAMACDIRVAASSARFAITPAKLGISYPQEDIARLVELVGPGQASRLLFSGSTIDGAEAGRIGLVEIVAEDVDTAAAGLIDALLANSPASLVALKRGIGLAAKGVASEPEQERLFEDLFGSDGVAGRLARLRGKA